MRPTSFTRSGGMFSGEGTLLGFSFLVGDTTQIKKGDRKGQDFTPLYLVYSFKKDGADEAATQRLLIGDADNYGPVSEDGSTLTIGDGRIGRDDAAVFVDTLCHPTDGGEGFPGDRFDEDPTTWNLEPAIGTRVRLAQVVNEAKTLRQGPQVGRDGRSWPRTDTKVETVIDLPTAQVKANGAAKKPAGKAAKGADVAGLAGATLIEILNNVDDGILSFPKLKMKVFGAFGAKHPQRELRDDVLKYLGDSTNLVGIDGVDFDGKTQQISLA